MTVAAIPANEWRERVIEEWRTRVQATGDYNLVNELAQALGYDAMALRSTRRHQEYVEGRRYVARALRAGGWSFPRIGRALGGRHHTTVMHLCGALGRQE